MSIKQKHDRFQQLWMMPSVRDYPKCYLDYSTNGFIQLGDIGDCILGIYKPNVSVTFLPDIILNIFLLLYSSSFLYY